MQNKILYLTICVTLFSSCIQNMDDMMIPSDTKPLQWSPDFCFPLVNADLKVEDILAYKNAGDLLVTDSLSGMLQLKYESGYTTLTVPEMFSFPPFSANSDIRLGSTEVNLLNTLGSFSQEFSFDFNYDAGAGIKINEAGLKSGTLSVNLQSDFPDDITLIFTIQNLQKSGVLLKDSVTLVYEGVPVSGGKDIPLNGYSLLMNNQSALSMSVTARFKSKGYSALVSNKIQISVGLNDPAFSKITGYFGQKQIGLPRDSILLRVFTNATKGYFEFAKPEIHIIVSNKFGIPLSGEFKTFESRNLLSGITVPVLFNNFLNPFAINSPPVSQIGTAAISNLLMDENNSNLNQLLNPAPKYIIYDVTLSLNPAGETQEENFITDADTLKFKTTVTLPLGGLAYDFSLSDTFPVSFKLDTDRISIEKLLMRVLINNYFPLNVGFQVYFTDSTYKKIDSLIHTSGQYLIQSGEVDNTGQVISPFSTLSDIGLDEGSSRSFLRSKFVITKADLETKDARSGKIVTLYKHYKFSVNLGVRMKVRIHISKKE